MKRTLGEGIGDQFRLWFVDKAMHTGPFPSRNETRPARTTRVVPYVGVLQQALRDLSAWVEHGLGPADSTEYEVVDGQVVVPPTATARKGIPVVGLTANGGERAEVLGGRDRRVRGPHRGAAPGTGVIVAAEWDFDGRGRLPGLRTVRVLATADGASATPACTASHAFAAPGVYFPALRATSHRQGNAGQRACPAAESRPCARGGAMNLSNFPKPEPLEMSDYIGGKVIVVTGAGGGFGRSISLKAASLGARLVCADIDADAVNATVQDIESAQGQAFGRQKMSQTPPR